jgi:sulfide:quinone oxidoreductase
MASSHEHPPKLRVVVVGGGVAALETALALADLAGERTAVTVVAPNAEFVYRPLSVREPFADGTARRYPVEPIVRDAGAELCADTLEWVDPPAHIAHTAAGMELEYDVLVLATGARKHARYEHAVTIDDAHMDEMLHGVIQDVEQGYIQHLAFVAPGRMAWPFPLYELALMTGARAWEMGVEMAITLITPEDSPLAIFGSTASRAVAQLLKDRRIETVTSAYAEVQRPGEIVVNPGERHVHVDRIIALPELYGPRMRGVPLGEHGFISVDPHGRLPALEGIYAAGDATDFPLKFGGIAAQQADVVAESIAAQAGAALTPQPFTPVIHGMLLTGAEPLYLSARITGGRGFASEASAEPSWQPPHKIAAKYLAPYLDARDRELDAGARERSSG